MRKPIYIQTKYLSPVILPPQRKTSHVNLHHPISLALLSKSSFSTLLSYHFYFIFFCFCFFVFFFSTNSPAICLIADMAECKVLKLSSHLAPSPPYRHLSPHRLAPLHPRPSSTQTSQPLDNSSILLVIITCLPHTHPALINVVCNTTNSPPPFHQPSLDPRRSHQSVSIVVVMLVIIMSLVVITIASTCVQPQSHLWISNQHRRPISPSTSSTIGF